MSGSIYPLPLVRYISEITKSLNEKSSYSIKEEHLWLWSARENDLLNDLRYEFSSRVIELDKLTNKIILK